MSPDSSSSTPGDVSPRGHGTQSLDSSQQSLLSLSSSQKDEYQHPSEPMTRPVIKSILNPNAPEFTPRKAEQQLLQQAAPDRIGSPGPNVPPSLISQQEFANPTSQFVVSCQAQTQAPVGHPSVSGGPPSGMGIPGTQAVPPRTCYSLPPQARPNGAPSMGGIHKAVMKLGKVLSLAEQASKIPDDDPDTLRQDIDGALKNEETFETSIDTTQSQVALTEGEFLPIRERNAKDVDKEEFNSPAVPREESCPEFMELSNNTAVVYNEMEAARVPGYRGVMPPNQLPSMSPDSSSSTPGDVSPCGHGTQILDSSQQSLLSLSSSQKDEYQHPSEPMTLPVIKSILNPNAPEFTPRKAGQQLLQQAAPDATRSPGPNVPPSLISQQEFANPTSQFVVSCQAQTQAPVGHPSVSGGPPSGMGIPGTQAVPPRTCYSLPPQARPNGAPSIGGIQKVMKLGKVLSLAEQASKIPDDDPDTLRQDIDGALKNEETFETSIDTTQSQVALTEGEFLPIRERNAKDVDKEEFNSPAVPREESCPEFMELSNNTTVVYNEMEAARVPGYRGVMPPNQLPSMSPDSSSSTPGDVSPCGHGTQILDSSQQSLLSLSSSQKDEYQHPSEPMTLPVIKSILNPNAPEFTPRKAGQQLLQQAAPDATRSPGPNVPPSLISQQEFANPTSQFVVSCQAQTQAPVGHPSVSGGPPSGMGIPGTQAVPPRTCYSLPPQARPNGAPSIGGIQKAVMKLGKVLSLAEQASKIPDDDPDTLRQDIDGALKNEETFETSIDTTQSQVALTEGEFLPIRERNAKDVDKEEFNSPAVPREESCPEFMELSNNTAVVYNEMEAARVPGYRGVMPPNQLPSMSPDSSSSTPGDVSPCGHGTQILDSSQQSLLSLSSSQKDEYQHPSEPMTLPVIKSILNPNAPEFTPRKAGQQLLQQAAPDATRSPGPNVPPSLISQQEFANPTSQFVVSCQAQTQAPVGHPSVSGGPPSGMGIPGTQAVPPRTCYSLPPQARPNGAPSIGGIQKGMKLGKVLPLAEQASKIQGDDPDTLRQDIDGALKNEETFETSIDTTQSQVALTEGEFLPIRERNAKDVDNEELNSPAVPREESCQEFMELSNNTTVVYNEMEAARAPGYRGVMHPNQLPSMSPDSSSSTPGDVSPRGHGTQSLDSSQQSLLFISSSQKDEYQHPSEPMTLPVIKSILNPNAPEFTPRKAGQQLLQQAAPDVEHLEPSN